MLTRNNCRQSCIVPLCRNTTKETPEKMFFVVPTNETSREKWFKAAKKSSWPSRGTFYCCEDHFELEKDTTNYKRYESEAAKSQTFLLRLKTNVVPHKFLPDSCVESQLQGRKAEFGTGAVFETANKCVNKKTNLKLKGKHAKAVRNVPKKRQYLKGYGNKAQVVKLNAKQEMKSNDCERKDLETNIRALLKSSKRLLININSPAENLEVGNGRVLALNDHNYSADTLERIKIINQNFYFDIQKLIKCKAWQAWRNSAVKTEVNKLFEQLGDITKLNKGFFRFHKNTYIKEENFSDIETDSAASIQTFQCEYCLMEYVESIQLKQHIEDIHKNKTESKFIHPVEKCQYDYCLSEFNEQDSLTQHTQETHEIETIEKYNCQDCSVKYVDQECLSQHILTDHLDIKPEVFYCNTCKCSILVVDVTGHLKMHESSLITQTVNRSTENKVTWRNLIDSFDAENDKKQCDTHENITIKTETEEIQYANNENITIKTETEEIQYANHDNIAIKIETEKIQNPHKDVIVKTEKDTEVDDVNAYHYHYHETWA